MTNFIKFRHPELRETKYIQKSKIYTISTNIDEEDEEEFSISFCFNKSLPEGEITTFYFDTKEEIREILNQLEE